MNRNLLRLVLSLLLTLPCGSSFAVLADAGHRPFNADVPRADGSPTPRRQYREPYVEVSNNPASPTTITVYTVVKKFNNPFGTANQTGGTLFYKGATQGVWQSVALGFHANESDFQYWKASFSSSSFAANEVIQYYFQLTFSSGAENTFIYAGAGFGDLASQTTNQQSVAASNPFTLRNRPAWIFHAGNRVVNGNDVQFWAKVGYIGDINNPATRWATNGALYYTTDGSAPTGSLGVGSDTTQVASFAYDHYENPGANGGDQSVAGTAMWWVANMPGFLQNVPVGATIRYRIGFWNTSNSEEKFADHNAGTNNTTYSFMNGVSGDPVLTITTPGNGTLNGNYTTTKLFIDEIKGDSIPVTVSFAPGQSNLTAVEIVTNLNQRDQATADRNANGIDDGMEFNETDSIIGSDTSYYYRSYAIAPANCSLGTCTTVINATRTGAYRLTARWKVNGDPNWRWFTNVAANRRDHAITVSPIDARNINLYEINTLTVEAKDNGGFIQRSTFEDLYDAPGAPRTGDGRGFNLDYLRGLGVNWLWFQPVHPPAVAGRETDPSTGQPYNPGSPYAVKNFFAINAWMSANYNGVDDVNGSTARQQAMTSFRDFVGAADLKNIGIMLDAPFNHTGLDCELSDVGVELFTRDGSPVPSATTTIRDWETRFYSKSGDYAQRAGLSSGYSDIAVAPDRGDFGKWNDVRDVYFGRYDALVNTNPNDNSSYLDERDRFYYAPTGSGTANNPENGNWTSNDFNQAGVPKNVTKQVWKYFARYPVFWLQQTRPAGQNRNSSTEPGLTIAQRYDWDHRGVDGLRADFGQGLPPQLWEYIINVARSYKWNFVVMSESLDGGAVTYRSNRHFDILNENIVFPLRSAGNAPDYRSIFDGRRGSYGQGLVLLNNTSHDEENYENIYLPLMRYQVTNTVDGAPMVFMGQELGITRTSGFSFYEVNFGKYIAHFKKFNSLQPAWLNRIASPFGEKFLFDAFSAPAQARQESPALRSSNRWYLNRLSDGQPRNEIWSVAKYEQANVPAGLQDVVFAFANLRTESGNSDAFNVNISQNGSNLFGINPARTYNVRNRAAYIGLGASSSTRRDDWLWGAGRSGSDILNNGIFVALNGVPANDAGWGTAPYEAQYLKLYDVAAPNTPAPAMPNVHAYAIGNSVTFTWNADPNVNANYIVTVMVNGGASPSFEVTTTSNSYTYTGAIGDQVSITVRAANPNSSAQSATSAATAAVKLLDPHGDEDLDGTINSDENMAGTDPRNAASYFRIVSVTRAADGATTVTWSSEPGKSYFLQAASTLAGTYADVHATAVTASGATASYTESAGTVGPRFYKVRVVP